MIGASVKTAAAAVVALVVASACSSSSPTGYPSVPSTAPGSHASSVRWSPCKGSAGPSGYQCATIEVPRDPQNPAQGGRIAMALDRRPASGGSVIGSLLVNPGGPGASGVDFLAALVPHLPAAILQHFDVVGFDPPGVGRTAPITCLPDAALERYYSMNPDPTTPAGLAATLSADRAFAQGCEQHSGVELPYVSTVDAAMDMDLIRQALGDPELNYLGFSYGTQLGATYAHLYPTHIRAMVLDGAIDPSLGPITAVDQQSVAIEADLDAALRACSAGSSCPWKPGGNPVAAFQALLSRVTTAPVPAAGTGQSVGPAALIYGTALTLYSTSSWPDLYQALAQLSAGNGRDMLSLFYDYIGIQANGTVSNELEANNAVSCLDAPVPPVSQIAADAAAARAQAPVFGAPGVYSELTCAVWPVPATGRPAPVHAAGSPPIVVVGTTGDPATPYSGVQALASQLDHGVLLTRVGYGHTAYLYSSCIRTFVDNYLLGLAVPPAGTRCPSG